MNKQQKLGQVRAFLTAAGASLATWGFNDGNAWAPIVGIILAAISGTWGLLHHKDPTTAGSLRWSLVRKFANVAGSACITYGFLNPERVQGIEVLIASAGPLLASWFSWIDNESMDDDELNGGGGTNMLWIVGFASILLTSCAEFPINARIDTDYGTIETDAKGGLVIRPIPRVIRIPIFNEK